MNSFNVTVNDALFYVKLLPMCLEFANFAKSQIPEQKPVAIYKQQVMMS